MVITLFFLCRIHIVTRTPSSLSPSPWIVTPLIWPGSCPGQVSAAHIRRRTVQVLQDEWVTGRQTNQVSLNDRDAPCRANRRDEEYCVRLKQRAALTTIKMAQENSAQVHEVSNWAERLDSTWTPPTLGAPAIPSPYRLKNCSEATTKSSRSFSSLSICVWMSCHV